MKIWIFPVLLSCCLQYCSASSCSCCEADIAKLTSNANAFIDNFVKGIGLAHETIDETLESCGKLFEVERSFLGAKYASNLVDARDKVKSFIDGSQDAADDFLNHFTTIESGCAALLDMCKEFAKKNDLTCRLVIFGKGCEAELNKRRCELSLFFREFEKLAANAVVYIKKIKCANDELVNLVADLQTATDSTGGGCGCSDGELAFCKFKTAVNQFFTNFNQVHWAGHLQMVNLQYVCDSVLRLASNLLNKFDCAKKL